MTSWPERCSIMISCPQGVTSGGSWCLFVPLGDVNFDHPIKVFWFLHSLVILFPFLINSLWERHLKDGSKNLLFSQNILLGFIFIYGSYFILSLSWRLQNEHFPTIGLPPHSPGGFLPFTVSKSSPFIHSSIYLSYSLLVRTNIFLFFPMLYDAWVDLIDLASGGPSNLAPVLSWHAPISLSLSPSLAFLA